MTDFPNTSRTNDVFDQAVILYLEKVAGDEHLADSILHMIAKWKKPYVLNLSKFRCRCDELYSYTAIKCTRGIMNLSKDSEKKTCFSLQCSPHKEDFAQITADTSSVTKE